jgi:hypothetical protein
MCKNLAMADFCDQLSDYMTLPPDKTQELVETIVNDEFMAKYGYDSVNVKADDPANPECPPNVEACWHDDDETLYYNADQLNSQGDSPKLIQTMVHEALHAMDYQDYGDSSDGLGDELSEKYTVRLYNEYGEDDEKMYAPGSAIPGIGHSEEVYKPAREIADKIHDVCNKKLQGKSPAERESILGQLEEEIKKILDQRWGAEDVDDDEE